MKTRERIQLGNQVITKQKIIISAILAIFQLTLNSLRVILWLTAGTSW